MSDLKLSDRLFNYIHNEVNSDFSGLCIQEAIEKDHFWLKNQNRYKTDKIQQLESELKKRDELLRGALEYLESVDMYGLSETDSKDCRRKANEIKAILEGE